MEALIELLSNLNAAVSAGFISGAPLSTLSCAVFMKAYYSNIAKTIKLNKQKPKEYEAEVKRAIARDLESRKMIVKDHKMMDGSTYTGNGVQIVYQLTKDSKKTTLFIPHAGKGTAVLANGDILVGYWDEGALSTAVDGVIHITDDIKETKLGMYKSKKFRYIGMFYNGKFIGHGKMEITDDKHIKEVEGDWCNNMPNGAAMINYYEGTKYLGGVRNFKKHGPGTFWDNNGFEIEGYWIDDLVHGDSNIKCNKTNILCKWEHGKIIGKCHIIFGNGNIYSGTCDNKFRPHGHGKMRYPDRSEYVGDWYEGARHGIGLCQYNNGDYYNGCWENDKPHGHGKMRYLDKSEYVGDWYEGARHGIGLCKYHNGDYYNGCWENDKRNKYGIFFMRTGSQTLVSIWNNDVMVCILNQYNY